jgi:hypothetical protein
MMNIPRALVTLAHDWRDLVSRRQVERELDEELRAYVYLLAAEKMRAGAEAEVARLDALAELGGMETVKALVREERSRLVAWAHERWDDVRVVLGRMVPVPEMPEPAPDEVSDAGWLEPMPSLQPHFVVRHPRET